MTGNQNDIAARIFRWLPQGWFPSGAGTRINAIVQGGAAVLASIYAQIAYVRLQTRIATASDGFLDLASYDFFAGNLPRLSASEPDALFSMRIRKEVIRERLTRHAIDQLLFDMTGHHPVITELQRPADVGCYGSSFYMGQALYGSHADPFAVFITTQHAGNFSIPNVAGWGSFLAGLGTHQMVACTDDMKVGAGFTDAQIYSALDRLRAAGVTFWVNITDGIDLIYLAGESGELLEAAPGELLII